MKNFAFGIAAAATIGLASLSAPASAATTAPAMTAHADTAGQITEFSSLMRRPIIRRGPVCTMKTIVKRGPHGRRIVNRVRVCR